APGARHLCSSKWDLLAKRFAVGTDPAAPGARHLCSSHWDLLAKRFAVGTDPKLDAAVAKKLATRKAGNSEFRNSVIFIRSMVAL
ncbi:MAG: hypothetical protein ACKN9S_04395, partial [Pirellula sp.]